MHLQGGEEKLDLAGTHLIVDKSTLVPAARLMRNADRL